MINEFSECLKKYIVSIDTSECHGTAFFIAPNLLCTSYHVIDGVPKDEILIKWQGKNILIDDCSQYERYDLAFLKTVTIDNKGWFPFNTKSKIIGEDFKAFGYPETHTNEGSPLLMTFTGADINDNILTFSGDNVTSGYSGCPIYSKDEKYVIGMMEISRDLLNPTGGRALNASKILELLCSDNKFYPYVVLMLGDNELSSALDIKWINSNRNLLSVFNRVIRDFFSMQITFSFSEIMFPLLKIKGIHNDNLYLSVAILIKQEYFDCLDLYKRWLIVNQKDNNKDQIHEALLYIGSDILPLSKIASDNSIAYCNTLCHTPIAGSRNLRLVELFNTDSNLFVPFNIELNGKNYCNKNVEEIFEILLENSRDYDMFVLSNQGIGKSTFSVCLFRYLCELRNKNYIDYIPVYVDLQQESIHTIFDRIWLNRKICLVYGENNLSYNYTREDFSKLVLIMDGLDEYLSVQTKNRVKSFFESPIFSVNNKLHIIITCRKFFYENYIRFNTVASKFYNVNLLPWEIQQKKIYIEKYLNAISNSKDINAKILKIKSAIFNNSFLCDLSGTPLYLNMSIEVLFEKEKHCIESLVDLYEQYTALWIRKEYDHNIDTYGTDFMIEDIPILLSQISWEYFKKYGTEFTKKDIFNAATKCVENKNLNIHDYEKAIKFILFNTFFIAENNNNRLDNIKYVHKSFFEFFVSKYIFNMLSSQTSPVDMLEIHKMFIPHEISEMIKEFFLQNNLKNSSPSRKIKKIIFQNCVSAIDYLNSKEHGEQNLLCFEEQRLASQQLIYHLGQVTLQETTKYLKEHLNLESDLWNRRTIALGLSFSGDSTELNKYISRMRRERELNKNALESNVNIGFSLSFFGDQPFDDEHPEIDQGLPQCKNTVIALINQLSAERNRPSWKNDIYTLVDLATNRKTSETEYITTIKANKERLLEVIEKVENYDSETKTWIEIKEMRAIISRIESED